jgi:hypothetical protein
MEISLENEIAQLRDLDLSGLRTRWRGEFRRDALPHLPRHLLFAVLAYRIQASRLGDLSTEAKTVLDRHVPGEDRSIVIDRLSRRDRQQATPAPGTILIRTWNGEPQRVTVMADGFGWNGKIYGSLSKVACAITGTRWNGPRFFGFRDNAPETDGRSARSRQ